MNLGALIGGAGTVLRRENAGWEGRGVQQGRSEMSSQGRRVVE